MPITQWKCPQCCRPVPLDHFAVTECGSIVHPDLASAVLADECGKDRRGVIGVSDLFGCPRKKAITEQADIAVDPQDYNAMVLGTAWNDFTDRTSDNPELCQVEVAGTLAGYPVIGHIDRIRNGVIQDWKLTNAFARKYIDPKGGPRTAKDPHIVQVSLYAELWRQMGNEPAGGEVWYQFTTGLVPVAFELWTLDRCLSFHPHGSDQSVADLLAILAEYVGGKRWQDLPLTGELMMFGTSTMCDPYCAVRDTCWTQAKGAPF